MALFGYGTCVYSSCIDTALQCSASGCRKVVAAHIHLVAPHEAPDFQIEPENLSISVCIYSNGRYQCLGRTSVIYKIPSESRDASTVVQPAGCVELKKAVGLEMEGFCVVRGEKQKGLVQAVRVACE
jgi:hypothetical protein